MQEISEKKKPKKDPCMLLGPLSDVRPFTADAKRPLSSLKRHSDVKEHRPTTNVVADAAESAQIVVIRERGSFVKYVSDAGTNNVHTTAPCGGNVVDPVVI